MTISDNVYTFAQRAMLFGPLNQAEATPAQWYGYLNAYYQNNGLYDSIQQAAYEAAVWTPAMKGLRNPAHRAVEFYVAKVWPGNLPGALPIVAKNERIVAPIQQIWKWSNWGVKKQVAVRFISKSGDWFAKVSTNAKTKKNGGDTVIVPATRTFFQNINAEYVTSFKLDERDFITYIRVEKPQTKTVNGKVVRYLHCETWDKETQLYKRYELRDTGAAHDLADQRPAETKTFESMGITFVPFVHTKFMDDGEETGPFANRGVGCFVHCLDKIDEVNRMATRLHQMMFRFNKPTMITSAGGNDESGRPLPPIEIDGESSGSVDMTDDTDIINLPGVSTFNYAVAPLNYSAFMEVINGTMQEIEQDLPEIKYFKMESGALSGKAIRLLLGDAVDRAIELRGNMETALARADAMALTMGQHANLPGFADLGSYDNGDFEHTFAERDVIAISQQERDEETRLFWTGWAALEGGSTPFPVYAGSMGWPQKKIDEALVATGLKVLENKTGVKP